MSIFSGLTVPGSFLRILEEVRSEPFTPKELEPLLGRGMRTYGELARLARLGWLLRIGRGRYATADPIVRLTPGAERGLAPYRGKCFHPTLHRMTGGALRTYGDRLIGLALFGSVARGAIQPGSDIDMAVFVDSVPSDVMEDLRETMYAERSARAVAMAEMDDSDHFHEPSVLSVPRGAFDSPGRILLGVVADARILYDPDSTVAAGITRLRRMFRRAGVREYRDDAGRPYWSTGTLFRDGGGG